MLELEQKEGCLYQLCVLSLPFIVTRSPNIDFVDKNIFEVGAVIGNKVVD